VAASKIGVNKLRAVKVKAKARVKARVKVKRAQNKAAVAANKGADKEAVSRATVKFQYGERGEFGLGSPRGEQ
jgi:hypothetical protein